MTRIQIVNSRLVEVRQELLAAQLTIDSVEQRRKQVKIAQELRNLANELDDWGRLTE